MIPELNQISAVARQVVVSRDWARVSACAMEIQRRSPEDPEGAFLMGLVQKAGQRTEAAAEYFEHALQLDADRYDAAVELANQYLVMHRYAEARDLLEKCKDKLANSPLYLDMAGTVYSAMSLHEDAWRLHKRADELQPNVETIQANLASCAVYVGKIDEARSIYRKLLKQHPSHQRNHYSLAQLDRARNDRHIKKMLKALRKGDKNPENNIYLYYGLGKEYEDLGRWNDAFRYFKAAGDAVKSVGDYRVDDDVQLMDKIVDVCTHAWLNDSPSKASTDKTPIFIVGLPRTGTTLTDRILSNHSLVQSAGETQLLQMVLRDGARAEHQIGITPQLIEKAAVRDPATIANSYAEAIAYRLGDEQFFIDKLPENVLYLGFIAKAWPDARIIHLRRHPMDTCFAVYKQSFFRFAYSLDDLAQYYLAYDRLSKHWRDVLQDRMIEVQYEELVSNQEEQTRRLLDLLDFEFEESCLQFDRNAAPIATASSVQVREKAHTRSVDRWRKFERQLKPLRAKLEAGGIVVD